jgi:hypothetical protein
VRGNLGSEGISRLSFRSNFRELKYSRVIETYFLRRLTGMAVASLFVQDATV